MADLTTNPTVGAVGTAAMGGAMAGGATAMAAMDGATAAESSVTTANI